MSHIAFVYGKPPRPPGKHIWQSECPSGSPEALADRRRSKHPCPMSLDHARWLVRWFSHGCRVVDPFAGGGNVLRAAVEQGQDATGIEVDERWIPGARENVRLAAAQQRLALEDRG